MTGWFYKIITRLLLRNFDYNPENVQILRDLAKQGIVCVVLPFKSSLLKAAFEQITKELNLPKGIEILFFSTPKTIATKRSKKVRDPLILKRLQQKDSSALVLFSEVAREWAVSLARAGFLDKFPGLACMAGWSHP